METVIADLKAFINKKENELIELQLSLNADTNQAVKMVQLIHEISEMKVQVIYHENRVADEMANRCKNCENGCRACWFGMH